MQLSKSQRKKSLIITFSRFSSSKSFSQHGTSLRNTRRHPHSSNFHVTGYPTPVVTWRKSSGLLPQGRVRYNNTALQISQVRKEDSEFYICSAENLLGKDDKKTMLVVVSLPWFTSKPPSKIVSILSFTVGLNCSATGDPQPTISWTKQGGQLPVGRSQQINGALMITNLQESDVGNYICTVTGVSVFRDIETVSTLEIQKGRILLENYNC